MPAAPIQTLLRALDAFTIVDLSTDVAVHDSGPFQTKVEVLEAQDGARFLVDRVLPRVAPQFAGAVRVEDFPGGAFLRHEHVTASVHAGSHIDAPGHYGGRLSSGSFINEAEIQSFLAPGVLLNGAAGKSSEVTWDELINEPPRESANGLEGKIVLIRTDHQRAISPHVITNLLNRGVRIIGTDNDSFDGSFPRMFERLVETRNPATLWPCHVLGRERPYFQLERLSNLELLPPDGFFVIALPILVRGATASWVRAVALVPRECPRTHGSLEVPYADPEKQHSH